MNYSMKAFNSRLMMCGASLALAMATTSAVAQDGAAEDDEADRIIVTGSRVLQDPLEARAPVQTFTYEDFENSGEASFGDYLQRIPANGSAINRTNNTSGNVGGPGDGSGLGAGALEIDLRYLQAKRTLVLVDGRRWVRNSSASGVGGSVDLNTIPQSAIGSVEVLLDGASTIYGSDAIGGVVNIKTRTDYDGFKASAYYGAFEQGDGESQVYDVSWGAESERGRIFASINLIDLNGVSSADRDITEYAIPGYEGGLSSNTPQGVYLFTNPDGVFNYITLNDGVTNTGRSNGGLPAYNPLMPDSGDFHSFGTPDRYNWQPQNSALNPSDRVSALVKGEYDVTDMITAKFMAAFTNRKSRSQAATEPLNFGTGSSPYLINIFIPADQEYNPFGFDIGMGPGQTNVRGFLRPLEVGPRIFEQNVDTWHIYGGLEGEFALGETDWFWDVNAGWFQSNATQFKYNGFNARNLAVGAGPAEDCEATPGCVPVNLFGGAGGLTPEMIEFVTYTQKDNSQQEIMDFSANISGSAFSLPGGPVGIAAGVEYREESGFFSPDERVISEETAVSAATPTNGKFEALEVYGEVVAPVHEQFDVISSVRVSDYSQFSTNTVYSAGFKATPFDTLTLRGNYSKGFRAPNIGELFNTVIENETQVNDACSGATGEIAANCATLGVPAGFMAMLPFYPVTSGGNENLEPEKSRNYTAGFTWDASDLMNLDRLVLDFNYYNIKIEDAVNVPIADVVVSQCASTLDAKYCDLVTRDPTTGEITGVDIRTNNIDGVSTSGLDASLSFSTPELSFGQIHVDWVSNYLLKYTETETRADGEIVKTSREGTEMGEVGRGFPEFKSVLTTRLDTGPFSAGATVSYISELDERCGGLTASFYFLPGVLDLCDNPGPPGGPEGTNTIADRIYLDLQASYRFGFNEDDNMSIAVGVQNVTDNDPPVCRSCRISGFNGQLYRFPGRFLYARLSVDLN